MSGFKFWVLVLAGVAFASGWAAGLLSAPGGDRSGAPGRFAAYQALLTREFDLSAERRLALEQVLGLYGRDIDLVRERYLARARTEMERELAETGLRYDDWIRNHVLPEGDRQRFDQLALAQKFPNTD